MLGVSLGLAPGLASAAQGSLAGESHTALLATNRLNVPGHNGYGFSNGVDQNSNSRIAFNNQSGATLASVRAVWSNWRATATHEESGLNDVTITASIEYPEGQFTQLTFAGSPFGTMGPDENLVSDDIVLTTPIPEGAMAHVREYREVAAGGKWPLQYLIRSPRWTKRYEAADFDTGVDKTLGGDITNATPSATRRGAGPIAILGVAHEGTPRRRAFASVGDSVLMYAGDGLVDAIGSEGWNGRGFSGRYPHMNFAVSGTKGKDNTAANFTRRRAALALCGVTDILCGFSHNDLAAGESMAELQATMTEILGMFQQDGYAIHHTTSLPRTTGDFATAAGQVFDPDGGAFAGGIGSRRHAFNTWIRGTPAPLAGYVDISDAVDVDANNVLSRGGGYWISGNGGLGETTPYLSTNGTVSDWGTRDGMHPNVVNNFAPEQGGHFVLRDVLVAYLDTLA